MSSDRSIAGDLLSARIGAVSALLFALCVVSACVSTGAGQSDFEEGGFFSPRREPTFNEYYRLDIKLPITEANLLSLLREHAIIFYALGPGASEHVNRRIPKPRWADDLDMTKIRSALRIMGTFDKARDRLPAYVGFIDERGLVVAIENDFSYGP